MEAHTEVVPRHWDQVQVRLIQIGYLIKMQSLGERKHPSDQGVVCRIIFFFIELK